MVNKEKVLRLQADRMNLYLHREEKSMIPREMLEEIARSKIGRVMPIEGKSVQITPSMISLAQLILKKI
jgi:hypothetical protein